MPNKVIILGQGEQGRLMKKVVDNYLNFEFVGFLDDSISTNETLGILDDYVKYLKKEYVFFVAMGNNEKRAKYFNAIDSSNGEFINIAHPSAIIENDVEIGRNVSIGAGAFINYSSKISDNCIINSCSIIEHDNIIGKHSHIAPGVMTAGGVSIGDKCFIGLGSRIIDHLAIGDNAIIGAGSNVLENALANSVYVGNPAKFVKAR